MSSRVADGSIMPRVTTGNTMAPCVVIGEPAWKSYELRISYDRRARETALRPSQVLLHAV